MKVIVKMLVLRRGSGWWSDVTDDNCMSGHWGHSQHRTLDIVKNRDENTFEADGQMRVENVTAEHAAVTGCEGGGGSR